MTEQRTSDQGCPDFKRNKPERVDQIPDGPVTSMGPELIVDHSQRHKGHACVHSLYTVASGERPAGWNQYPTKNECVAVRDALGRKRSILLVVLVLFRVECLVRHIELEDVEPRPKDGVRQMCDVRQWCRRDSEDSLGSEKVSQC